MADDNLATKAPESDAATGSASEPVIPSDTAAQKGPTLGEHCVSDRPTPAGKSGTGEIRKLGDVDAYISKPADYPHAPAKLLLLLTNGTGHKSTNNQIQADKFASQGFVVVMPDLFGGDAFPSSSSAVAEDEGEDVSLIEQIKIKAAEAAKSFMIDMWMARHTEAKVLPILHKVIDACKEEFADAVSNGGGIYAVGYCFGGRYVILLASEHQPGTVGGWSGAAAQTPADEESGAKTRGPLIKVGAVAHPTLVSREDFRTVKAPLSLACVENDPLFPDEIRTALEDTLTKINLEHEVQVYPEVPHGFAVVGEYESETIKAAQETAYDQMLKWLVEH